jgi:hypothetical protein
MDAERFDQVVMALSRGNSRRRALKALLGGGLGAGLLALRGGHTGAVPGCRGQGEPCEGNQTCCAGLECRDRFTPPPDLPLDARATDKRCGGPGLPGGLDG